VIEIENLSKRYGEKLAVDGLDFVVQPGTVTGFLGPNGAGKSTTMRMIAGLDEPTAARALVNGKDYRAASAPMAELASCWRPRRCTPAGRPATICWRWPRPTVSASAGSMR
jgi:ABC-type multidrug transport system ATPase subunit